jgi:hypothetical protein
MYDEEKEGFICEYAVGNSTSGAIERMRVLGAWQWHHAVGSCRRLLGTKRGLILEDLEKGGRFSCPE